MRKGRHQYVMSPYTYLVPILRTGLYRTTQPAQNSTEGSQNLDKKITENQQAQNPENQQSQRDSTSPSATANSNSVSLKDRHLF